MFDRLKLNLTEEEINKIQNTKVLVIGLGGVGGMSVELISRFGINNITIVDNDCFEESNLNRQILSLKSNIGRKKTEIAKERILSINESANVCTIDKFIDKDNIDDLFINDLDYIIDACDTISTKTLLIKKCIEKDIKIISCMGTANKLHPELLEVTELSKTSYDPIARILRNNFKDYKGKIMVVSSTEEPIEANGLGSNSLVPNAAGLLCASYVINDIIKRK